MCIWLLRIHRWDIAKRDKEKEADRGVWRSVEGETIKIEQRESERERKKRREKRDKMYV